MKLLHLNELMLIPVKLQKKKKKKKKKKKWTGNKKLIIIVCKFSMTFEPHSSLPENIEFYSHETGPYLL